MSDFQQRSGFGRMMRIVLPEIQLFDLIRQRGWRGASGSNGVVSTLKRDLAANKLTGLLYLISVPTLVLTFLLTMLWSLISLDDMRVILNQEVPQAYDDIIVLFFSGILIYLTLRFRSLGGWLYDSFPILLALLQMAFFLLLGIGTGTYILTIWANDLTFSKGVAVLLALLAVLFARVLMSVWFTFRPLTGQPTGGEALPGQHLFRTGTGAFVLAFFLLICFTPLGGNTLDDDQKYALLTNRAATGVYAGELLFDTETNWDITPVDFQVTGLGSDGSTAKMLIWDFNQEDLDHVQVLVDGKPLSDYTELTNTSQLYRIPVPSTVTVKGVKDSGGGISYAVKFPENNTTNFNVVTVGGTNTFHVLAP